MAMASHLGMQTMALVTTVIAAPALAAPAPNTRLVACEAGNCLLVTGHRANAASAVRINGHAVPATGKRNWKVSLPVETVRQWSAPFARTISVEIEDIKTRNATSAEARLPIGLLGHAEDLAMLVISAK
jgi:hypothetical protein